MSGRAARTWAALLEDLDLELAHVARPGPWAKHGRCRGAPSAVFFPGRGDDASAAKAICRRCPVLQECRDYALAAPQQLVGVWGGLTGRERRAVQEQLRREQDAPAPVEPTVPRPVRAPAGELLDVLEALAEHPRAWARVASYASPGSAQTVASLLRTGRRAVPPGEWEFAGRRNGAGGSDLYARRLEEGAAEGAA